MKTIKGIIEQIKTGNYDTGEYSTEGDMNYLHLNDILKEIKDVSFENESDFHSHLENEVRRIMKDAISELSSIIRYSE